MSFVLISQTKTFEFAISIISLFYCEFNFRNAFVFLISNIIDAIARSTQTRIFFDARNSSRFLIFELKLIHFVIKTILAFKKETNFRLRFSSFVQSIVDFAIKLTQIEILLDTTKKTSIFAKQ